MMTKGQISPVPKEKYHNDLVLGCEQGYSEVSYIGDDRGT